MRNQEKNLEKKKLGRPAIGKGVQLNAMVRPELAEALDRWRAAQPGQIPSRPAAVRIALGEWLTDKGLLRQH
jgi:hypothetical protein